MNITNALKGWLVEHDKVKETASDEEFNEAALTAIADGSLDPAKLHELTAPKTETKDEPPEWQKAIDALTEQVGTLTSTLTERADKEETLTKQVETIVKSMQPAELEVKEDSKVTPAKMFAQEERQAKADVIPVTKQFSSQRQDLFHSKELGGERAVFGRDRSPLDLPSGVASMGPIPLESSSDLDHAVNAAYFKWAANAQNLTGRNLPRWLQMTDLDKQLMEHALHESKWTGIVGRGSSDDATVDDLHSPNVVHNKRLTDSQRKALLDDSTSGGLEAAPIEFDAAVITTPVLHGELFPLVSVVPVTRGSRMEGFAISNPSFTSGTAEGTAISLFTTTSMVSAFDTTIYNAVGAIEIGRDFEQDSPVNMGQLITQLYGEKAKEWLDNQIANGDGTTEPQGLFNASGITDIGNPAGGANAAPQPDDFVTLWGSVAKQYRPNSDRARCVYVANDTSYRRMRAIQVGAADERPVFGLGISDYDCYTYPFKVQNDIANTVAGFFAMKYYRMYRRLGLTIRVETGGKELALKNQTLIVVRMRWGGKLELGGAGSYSDNWQT